MIADAVNIKDKYKPVGHKPIQIGDVVLLKENNIKIANYPMGIVRQVFTNHLDEVTGALVLKGNSRETVKRHASSLIPLLGREEYLHQNQSDVSEVITVPVDSSSRKSSRKAAIRCRENTKRLIDNNLL